MLKKIINKIIEGFIKTSGWVSSIIVLLIIIFLFKEASGLFNKTPLEEGYMLVVNKKNPIDKLNPDQLKNIFDRDSTSWKTLGGMNADIEIFTVEDISTFYNDSMIGENMSNLPWCINDHISLLVSLVAILIALPIGLAAAIYLAEVADSRIRTILKPVIELLAGIPSVVYGFFGLVIIVPFVQKIFNLPVGETGLTGSIILAIMALPTIITVAEDALRSVPKAMKEASLALGATHWQTIYKVMIPYASSGITAAAILGIGRAIGETMVALMVTGNANNFTFSLLKPIRTIPATIAAELGEASYGGLHFKALFALGCILFLITLMINIYVEYLSGKKQTK